MSEPLSFGQVWEVLAFNPQWSGAYGPKGEPPLTGEEKGKICGFITSRLKKSFEANGPDFFGELWPYIKSPIACQNWYAVKPYDRGPMILFNAIYKRASGIAQKNMKAKPIGPVMAEVANEILEKIIHKASA